MRRTWYFMRSKKNSRWKLAVGLCALFLPLSLAMAAAKGKPFYDSGNERYKAKKYILGIAFFKTAASVDPQNYGAKGNYKVALSYAKLKKCPQALEYFKKAYQYDSVKGGASTPAKFQEKVKGCGFTLAQVSAGASSEPVTKQAKLPASGSVVDLKPEKEPTKAQNIITGVFNSFHWLQYLIPIGIMGFFIRSWLKGRALASSQTGRGADAYHDDDSDDFDTGYYEDDSDSDSGAGTGTGAAAGAVAAGAAAGYVASQMEDQETSGFADEAGSEDGGAFAAENDSGGDTDVS